MMVCPNCRSEYRDGFTHCADCFVDLVAGPLSTEPVSDAHEVELVSVFETGNPSLVSVAKSLLDSAGIQFVTRGEALQDLFGLGRFPASMSVVAGPVVFQVARADAADAAALLNDLKSDRQPDHEDANSDDKQPES
jgi:putative signal transducing protein